MFHRAAGTHKPFVHAEVTGCGYAFHKSPMLSFSTANQRRGLEARLSAIRMVHDSFRAGFSSATSWTRMRKRKRRVRRCADIATMCAIRVSSGSVGGEPEVRESVPSGRKGGATAAEGLSFTSRDFAPAQSLYEVVHLFILCFRRLRSAVIAP